MACLQVMAIWKYLNSPKVPEGTWFWFLDADAVITNYAADVLERAQQAPAFQDAFEDYQQPAVEDPSLFVAAHSVQPWYINQVRCAPEQGRFFFCAELQTCHAVPHGLPQRSCAPACVAFLRGCCR